MPVAGSDDDPRPRRRGDRGDHQLHQHLQPERDAGRRSARAQRRGARPEAQAARQDLAGARLQGGHRLPEGGRRDGRPARRWASIWWATAAPPASATPGRWPSRSPRRSTTATWWSPPCCPAIATSRAASTRRSRRATLASPPLVVAYALAGSLRKDLTTEPLGKDRDGRDVYLRDIWPSPAEVAKEIRSEVSDAMFRKAYDSVFEGDARWQRIGGAAAGRTYDWDEASTYVRLPPYFEGMSPHARGRRATSRARASSRCSAIQHHHRPHLARRLDRQGQPGRPLPDRARRGGARLQLLRRAPRQPRGHDARHARQHPPAQRDGGRPERRLDQADAGRRADDDLPRRDALSGARRAAGDHRRQGVRLGLVARLGRQGRATSWASRR